MTKWNRVGAPSTAPLHRLVATGGALVAAACSGAGGAPPPAAGTTQFTILPASYTGVRFENRLRDTRDVNVFTYRNYYNGGGVAIGDLSGDHRPDLLLTANQGPSRLYVNDGEFRFRDVTGAAGLDLDHGWATGVQFADVNGDGRLDIYLCYAGPVPPDHRANRLYINQGTGADGVPTFGERAAGYGIADRGYSTHAAFFDYDRDGDLDLYVVNNSARPIGTFGRENLRLVRDADGGDRLYRNDGSRFTDVSAAAGIYGGATGFGLGVAVSDVSRDGWPDIYVSNDFFERDFLYINNGDGTFAERIEQAMPSISYSSMGLDAADLDNDGWPEVYVTDMLPADDRRLKLVTSFENWASYRASVQEGFHHQFTRNTLQRNNRNGTFSEIGELAGVARTDWSWSALIADYDLDGRADIFVTNGIARDLTSQDYLVFLSQDATMRAAIDGKRVDYLRLIAAMGTTPLANYAFRNTGTGEHDLAFQNAAAPWGLAAPTFSGGAAYGDLDGDGDLDLVVNNLNEEAFVYRNNARQTGNASLQVALAGDGKNPFAIGAAVTVWRGDRLQFQELQPSRGFQSSVDYVLTFGLGPDSSAIDSVTVEWPDGRVTTIRAVAPNHRVTVRHSDAPPAPDQPRPPVRPSAGPPLFLDVTDRVALPYVHRENEFADFDREPLMPKLVSTEGPFMAVGDVNGDGLEDIFLGGAKGQPGAILIQRPDGRFGPSNERVLDADRISEDLGAAFFDADGDGDQDLYVVSGGSEFSDMAPALEDRLYLNDGRGFFRKATGRLPPMNLSGSVVRAADFDADGDLDLFVGGRVVPWRYGIDPQSLLLANDGRGRFTDVTAPAAPELARVGMVTDAVWTDADGDRRIDLVVVGDWMPITIFRNAGGGRLERLRAPGLDSSGGWWNRIVAADFTGDGRVDFVVGNLGLNSRLRATPTEPATMHVKDFDGNGSMEQIVATYADGASRALPVRDDLLRALPHLKARFLDHEEYARQTVPAMFAAAEQAGMVRKEAHTFATSLVRNEGGGRFTLVPLPREVQIAPVYGILAADVDRDGALDLLLAGNFDGVKPELGRMHASYGLYLKGDGRGGFSPVAGVASGFVVPGQARDIQRLRTPRGEIYIVMRNNDRPLIFRAAPVSPRRSLAVGR